MLYADATKQIKEYLQFLFPSYPTWSYDIVENPFYVSWIVRFKNTDPAIGFDVHVQGGAGNAEVKIDFNQNLKLEWKQTYNISTMLLVISGIMDTFTHLKDITN